MTRRTEALAVLVCSVQWELEEAAYEIGGGRYTAERRHRLAGRLMELVEALQDADGPVIVDAPAE